MEFLPELEFGKAADEGAELVGSTGWESGAVLDLRVNLGREEANQEVKQVDTEAVGDDIEALNQVHAYGVDENDYETGDPTVEDVWDSFVQQVLVPPRNGEAPP